MAQSPCPPTLEAVGPGKEVRVVRRWSEQGVPFVKLAVPEIGSEVDYSVRRLAEDNGATFAVLELAPGWPGAQAGHRSLVRIADPDTVRTLTTDDFNQVVVRCGEVLAGEAACSVPDAEAVFGAMPDWLSPEFRAQEKPLRAESEQGREIRCFHCEKPIADAEAACPHCGRSRLAPRCPRCGGLVSPERDKHVYYADENGYYPWHHAWDGRCASCGFEFVARLVIETGHAPFLASNDHHAQIEQWKAEPTLSHPFAGFSRLEIRGAESVHMVCDLWDYQPTIEVRIQRAVAANAGEPAGSLTKEARVVMTLAEWRAVIENLQGPLRVLMERKPWTRDTT